MSNYVKSTNFYAKDALSSGNPDKIIKGAEIDDEFNNIATAVSTKADLNSPTFTGVPLAPTATSGTNTTQVATTAFVQAIAGALGTMSSQNKTAVDITGGTIVGITDLAIADGGTGVSSLTPNAVLTGNTTSTGAVTSVSPGTLANVLTSTAGTTVTAGNFVVGVQYSILTVGSTSFTAIGASSNTVGVVFTATGVGSGTGTASVTTWASAAPTGFGVSQTWQAVTRVAGTTYTNSTSKPIVAAIVVSMSFSGSGTCKATVAGTDIYSMSYNTTAGGGGVPVTLSVIVPVGSTYVLTLTSGMTLSSWTEFR